MKSINQKTLSIMALLFACCLLSACGGGGGGAVTPIVTTTSVASSSVVNNATDVSTALTGIQIRFSKSMNPVTTAAAFSITPAIAGQINVSSDLLTYSFDTTLAAGTTYMITITTAATDTNGESLDTPYTLSFRTIGSAASAPNAITNLTMASGTSFGQLKMTFSAPAPGTDTVSAYLIKYSTSLITDSTFDTGTTVYSLPAGITIPTPAAAGTLQTISINSALLTHSLPGETLFFAVKATTLTNSLSSLSNVSSIAAPWYMDLVIRRTAATTNLSSVKLGAQLSATDQYDAAFDTESPPIITGLKSVFTLAGRAEELIRDIRTPLNKGDTKTFILDITGIASDSLRLEFPAFSTTTPLYTFKVGGIESYEVTITGATLPFMLDGSGAKQLSIIVTR